jgi:hypothetical protein
MAVDLTLPLREAVVALIRANGPLVALWEGRFYGERPPSDTEWPFGRYGYDTMAPFNPACITGNAVDVTIHTFSQSPDTKEIKLINAAVIVALDDATLNLDGGGWCYDLTFVRAQTLPDGPDGHHGVLQFNALAGIED